MGRADEDLRDGGAATGTLYHLGTPLGFTSHVDFGECDTLAPKQSFRRNAKRTRWRRINHNRWHSGLAWEPPAVEAHATLDGRASRRHNPGEHQHIDAAGTRTQERPRAGFDGRTGRQDVIDEDKTPTVDRGLAVVGDGERPLDIGGALGMRQSDLLLRGASPLQRPGT